MCLCVFNRNKHRYIQYTYIDTSTCINNVHIHMSVYANVMQGYMSIFTFILLPVYHLSALSPAGALKSWHPHFSDHTIPSTHILFLVPFSVQRNQDSLEKSLPLGRRRGKPKANLDSLVASGRKKVLQEGCSVSGRGLLLDQSPAICRLK